MIGREASASCLPAMVVQYKPNRSETKIELQSGSRSLDLLLSSWQWGAIEQRNMYTGGWCLKNIWRFGYCWTWSFSSHFISHYIHISVLRATRGWADVCGSLPTWWMGVGHSSSEHWGESMTLWDVGQWSAHFMSQMNLNRTCCEIARYWQPDCIRDCSMVCVGEGNLWMVWAVRWNEGYGGSIVGVKRGA